MQRFKSVNEYIEGHPEWETELLELRKILTSTDLEETVKWGAPCYTLNGKNVVGIGAFSGYVGLWFHQGVFLKDPDGVLVNAQEGKTRALRQLRFESEQEIKVTRVKAYVREAIANQRAGKAIQAQRGKRVVLPAELEQVLARKAKTQKAFAALSQGKQREYADYISEAKRAATRESRLAKILPMIESGVGLNDKYRR